MMLPEQVDSMDSSRVEIRLSSGHHSIVDKFLIERLWNYLSYQNLHKILSSVEREIEVFYDGIKVLTAHVPETVFNPYKGSAATKVIEFILSERICVKGRRTIDLGCGSGVVGLAAIHMGASSVLFSDVNPHVVSSLKNHPNIRPQDEFCIQNGLVGTVAAATGDFDLVIAILPMLAVEDVTASNASYEVGIMRPKDLLTRFVEQSHQVLRQGGQIVFYVSIPSAGGIRAYHVFVSHLNAYFDFNSYRILAHQHLKSMGGDHIIFEATKS
jgi:methylase of polypeptide subunit release factors